MSETRAVRVDTLKAGQIVKYEQDILVLVDLLQIDKSMWVEAAVCGQLKIGSAKKHIPITALVIPLDADFYDSGECVHRTYTQDDEDDSIKPTIGQQPNFMPCKPTACFNCKTKPARLSSNYCSDTCYRESEVKHYARGGY